MPRLEVCEDKNGKYIDIPIELLSSIGVTDKNEIKITKQKNRLFVERR